MKCIFPDGTMLAYINIQLYHINFTMDQQKLQEDIAYYQSLSDKLRVDDKGVVYLTLENSEIVGLSPELLMSLLKISEEDARLVMRQAVEHALSNLVYSGDQMSSLLVDILQDMEYERNAPEYEKNSLLTVDDIAHLGNLSYALVHGIFHQYQKAIRSEKDLDQFLDFVNHIIQKEFKGDLSKAIAHYDHRQDNFDRLLSQTAPEELMPISEQKMLQYYREAQDILCKSLSISQQDADILLGDAQILKEFLHCDDVSKVQNIINKALRGDASFLITALGNRAPQGVKESKKPIKNLLEETIENKPQPLPETLEDTLRLAFKMRSRITAKSLCNIFRIKGHSISLALGRLIIDEGKYGTIVESKKYITTADGVERLIQDIQQAGGLEKFIEIYLNIVNDKVTEHFYPSKKEQ